MQKKLKKFTNFLSKASLFFFYTLVLLVCLTLNTFGPPYLTVIEDFFLFAPRWLIFLPIVFTILTSWSLIYKHKAPIAVSVFYILFFYLNFNVPILQYEQNKDTKNQISIMTANLGNTKESTLKISEQIKKYQLSVIALQETSKAQTQKIIPKGWDLKCDSHMCLASAYPVTLVNSQSRRILGGWGNIGTLFNIKIEDEIIYILNIHLETPRKGFERFQLSKFNFHVLNDNYEQRYMEASIIQGWANNFDKKIILGDFNMSVESSIYTTFFTEFENTFNTNGVGFGYTKYTRIHGVRIDHILIDKDFQTLAAEVGGDFGGDHRPMIAKLAF